MSNNLSKEDLTKALASNYSKAKAILNNPQKAKEFIHNFQQWLKKHRDIPVLGKVLSELENLLSMVADYINKEYTNIPKGSIISAIACLIYVLSPVDLIPDFIPIIGYMDDVAIITLALEIGLSNDLANYSKWKRKRIDERLLKKAKTIVPSITTEIKDEEIVGVEILPDFSVRILTNSGVTTEKPFECFAYLYRFNDKVFDDDDIITNDDKINFIKLIFSEDLITWNKSCTERIKEEYKFTDYDEFYIIIDKE